jgi:hypothetical protein
MRLVAFKCSYILLLLCVPVDNTPLVIGVCYVLLLLLVLMLCASSHLLLQRMCLSKKKKAATGKEAMLL